MPFIFEVSHTEIIHFCSIFISISWCGCPQCLAKFVLQLGGLWRYIHRGAKHILYHLYTYFIRTHTQIHVCIYMYIYIYIHMHIFVSEHICICKIICTFLCTYMCRVNWVYIESEGGGRVTVVVRMVGSPCSIETI